MTNLVLPLSCNQSIAYFTTIISQSEIENLNCTCSNYYHMFLFLCTICSEKLYQPFFTPPDRYDYNTNTAGETPKIEHHNLSFLELKGYAGLREDVEVVRYIWLIMERAACLKKIHLLERCPLRNCYGVRCACHVDEPHTTLLSEALASRAGSSLEITVELINVPCWH